METVATLPREALSKALGGNPRVVAAFEAQAQKVEETATAASSTAQATEALQDASFLTLAANASLTGERVLQLGDGLSADDGGDTLTLRVNDDVPHSIGGFSIHLTAIGATNLVLPLSGRLATTTGAETLSAKTLAAPKLSGLTDAANDGAAATAGVPVGGVYRTGSALMVRVA